MADPAHDSASVAGDGDGAVAVVQAFEDVSDRRVDGDRLCRGGEGGDGGVLAGCEGVHDGVGGEHAEVAAVGVEDGQVAVAGGGEALAAIVSPVS